MTHTFRARGIELELPTGWENISESQDEPLALTDPKEGLGGLQITVALYDGDGEPEPTISDLQEMLDEFAKTQNLVPLEPPQELLSNHSQVTIVAASFQFMKSEFLRVFYLADKVHFVFATYTCALEDQREERDLCESIIKSLYFTPSAV